MAVTLKAMRINSTMSLQDVADKIGVSKQQVWLYEKAPHKIPAELLQKLCNLYGCKMDDIFLG